MGTSQFGTNTIVIKCHDVDKQIRNIESADLYKKYFSSKFGETLKSILNKYKQTSFDRVFNSLSADQLDELAEKANANSHLALFTKPYKAPNFNNFLRIKCTNDTPKQKLLELLRNEKDIVEYAYFQGRTFPATAPSGNHRSLASDQGYLNAAPGGIDARFARGHGGDGSGVNFVDIEDGWTHLITPHPDLPNPGTIQLLAGVNEPGNGLHGNSVLGIIVAKDNGHGITGIAPKVQADVASEFFAGSNDAQAANAIGFLAHSLQPGDIILLELQYEDLRTNLTVEQNKNNFPVEYDKASFDAIQAAVASGIIVIEAAGNAGQNLDNFTYDWMSEESGAIIVGSATSSQPHQRTSLTNYGKRVDCYAWGEKITTTSNTAYRSDFGDTSGASAIIAGAAIAVQSMYFKKNATKLRGHQMKNWLRDPSTGTNSADPIGVMPDLKKIHSKINSGAPGS